MDLIQTLHLTGKVLSIKRLPDAEAQNTAGKGCSLATLQGALDGETLVFTEASLGCKGGAAGFGFTDAKPDIPGGVGLFLSCGKGEGFPPGERIKQSPELGERMLEIQPKGVMTGFRALRVKPYAPEDEADTVTMLVNADQLALLTHIFGFRKALLDEVYAPMVSGCASVFRLPFGELERESPRAVIGNIDVFSRPHFPKETFFFTVSGRDFATMRQDAGDSVLRSHISQKTLGRLE